MLGSLYSRSIIGNSRTLNFKGYFQSSTLRSSSSSPKTNSQTLRSSPNFQVISSKLCNKKNKNIVSNQRFENNYKNGHNYRRNPENKEQPVGAGGGFNIQWLWLLALLINETEENQQQNQDEDQQNTEENQENLDEDQQKNQQKPEESQENLDPKSEEDHQKTSSEEISQSDFKEEIVISEIGPLVVIQEITLESPPSSPINDSPEKNQPDEKPLSEYEIKMIEENKVLEEELQLLKIELLLRREENQILETQHQIEIEKTQYEAEQSNHTFQKHQNHSFEILKQEELKFRTEDQERLDIEKKVKEKIDNFLLEYKLRWEQLFEMDLENYLEDVENFREVFKKTSQDLLVEFLEPSEISFKEHITNVENTIDQQTTVFMNENLQKTFDENQIIENQILLETQQQLDHNYRILERQKNLFIVLQNT